MPHHSALASEAGRLQHIRARIRASLCGCPWIAHSPQTSPVLPCDTLFWSGPISGLASRDLSAHREEVAASLTRRAWQREHPGTQRFPSFRCQPGSEARGRGPGLRVSPHGTCSPRAAPPAWHSRPVSMGGRVREALGPGRVADSDDPLVRHLAVLIPLAARTPPEAVAAFVDPLQQTISSVSPAVLRIGPPRTPHAFVLADGERQTV